MESFSFGQRVTRRPTKRIPVKAPSRNSTSSISNAVSSGNPTNSCLNPETIPMETGGIDITTTTQYERRQIMDQAAQKQSELPELMRFHYFHIRN